jgi:hypothetical protein
LAQIKASRACPDFSDISVKQGAAEATKCDRNKIFEAGGPTAAKRQGGNKIFGPLPPEMSMICARPRPPLISCRRCSALSAGKGELYKGQPALAPLARKAGIPDRVAFYRRAAGHSMEKVLQPDALARQPPRLLTSSTERWNDVPRGTTDEVSSHVRLDLPFV